MDVHALFDKLLTDLAPEGVTEAHDDLGARLLVRDGVPFARLGQDERMAFRSVPGHGRPSAVQSRTADLRSAENVGDWVVVAADDVSRWEGLARDALATAR